MPVRIQRRRTKGWRMPENTVSVTRPGKWGNSYKPEDLIIKTREEALRFYIQDLNYYKWHDEIKKELKGKNLACWCKIGDPCHADILLEIANS